MLAIPRLNKRVEDFVADAQSTDHLFDFERRSVAPKPRPSSRRARQVNPINGTNERALSFAATAPLVVRERDEPSIPRATSPFRIGPRHLDGVVNRTQSRTLLRWGGFHDRKRTVVDHLHDKDQCLRPEKWADDHQLVQRHSCGTECLNVPLLGGARRLLTR